MPANRKNKAMIVIRLVLWASFVLAMSASVSHLAWAFGTLEFKDSSALGWMAAISIDAGLASLAYSIQQHKKARRPTKGLWFGVGLFSLISAFANLLHAMTVEANGVVIMQTFSQVDALVLLKAIILSASLPLLVLYMGSVVSSDDIQAAKESDRENKHKEPVVSPYTVTPEVPPVSGLPQLETTQTPQLEAPKQRIPVENYAAFVVAMNGMADRPQSGSQVEKTFELSHASAYRYWKAYCKGE